MAKTVGEFIEEAEEIIARKQRGELDVSEAAYGFTGAGMHIEGKEKTPEFEAVFNLVADLEILHVKAMGLSAKSVVALQEKEWKKFEVLFARLKEKVGLLGNTKSFLEEKK